MARLPLVFAGSDYWDRTSSLIDGSVKPEGIELNWVHEGPQAFGRMIRGEFESGEMSASFLVMMVSQGIDTLVGLPIFTSRAFRHGNAFVRTDAGIEEPEDLAGKRVGVPDYPMTSAVWVRGFLEHDYGVKSGDMKWVQGGLETPSAPGYNERVSFELPSTIQLTDLPPNTTLMAKLLEGELDAVTGPSRPRSVAGNPKVRPLIPNNIEAEKAYYARTGIFPITHMVVLRRDVYERNRWIASSLAAAFEQAKSAGWRELTGHQAPFLPWMPEYFQEVDATFKGNPYRDGFEENYAALNALTQYSYEQGLSKRKVDPEEIFAPETLKALH